MVLLLGMACVAQLCGTCRIKSTKIQMDAAETNDGADSTAFTLYMKNILDMV